MKQWEIMEALPEHIPAIAADMRQADRREVWASHRHTPAQALTFSLQHSELAWTCLVDGTPAIMWGVARLGSLISYKGAPWLLGTDLFFRRIPALHREFLRQCPDYVARMQARFPRLENIVHAKHRSALRWLRWLGFTVGAQTVERNGEQFFPFWKGAVWQ